MIQSMLAQRDQQIAQLNAQLASLMAAPPPPQVYAAQPDTGAYHSHPVVRVGGRTCFRKVCFDRGLTVCLCGSWGWVLFCGVMCRQ